MPFYHKMGNIPHKRHTVFKSPEGKFYYEQLFGTEGFSSMSTLMYHVHRPTMVKSVGNPIDMTPVAAIKNNIKSQMLNGFQLKPQNDYLESRKTVLFNNDLNITLAAPKESLMRYFYKNADADEMIFIHKGTGTLRTMLGNLKFSCGDYLIVPRGIIYQIEFDTDDNRLFIVESFSPILTPRTYRNKFGQLLEHSPFCERDLRAPEVLETHDEKGEFSHQSVKKKTSCTNWFMALIRLMLWVMTATISRMRSQSTILNQLRVVYTCRRRFTKRSKRTILWCVRFVRVCMTIIRRPFRRPTTTATSIAMRFCIT